MMDKRQLLSNLDLLATAPGGVARLRELILTLAVQGKLVPQDPADEPAGVLLQKIRAEKDRLIAEGKIKRDKPLAAIADEEKPFGLPVGWEWVRLGEITNYGTTTKAEELQADTWVLDMEDIEKSSGRLLQRLRFAQRPALSDKNCFLAGDVLYGKLRPYLNKVLVADEAGVCTTEIIPFRCYGDYVPQYFRLVLSSPFFLDYVNARSYGMKMPRLGTEDARKSVIPLPPLAEQSRIVARVETLMRLCDALEAKGRLEAAQHAQLVGTLLGTLTASATSQELAENWQRVARHFDRLLDRPEAIAALEQTLLQLAVRGLLVPQDAADEPASALLQRIRSEKDRLIAAGQIKRDKALSTVADEDKPFDLPVGWEWVRVGEVVEMLNGYAFKSDWFKQAGVRLLRNVNVSHGHVDWSQSAMLDPVAAKEYEPFALRAGDIVLSLDRPIISTGLKYAVVRKSDLPCLLLQRVARLAPVAVVVSPEFLVLWLQSDLFMGTIDPGRSNGVPHISTKQVAGLTFALPPLAEQTRIVARVTALRRLCAELRQRLAEGQATQARLAEALLQAA